MRRTSESAIDNRTPASPSSRDTTVSPAPQSNTTAVTSPEPHGLDTIHVLKNQEIGSYSLTPQTAGARLSQSPGQPSRDLGAPELAMYEEDDAACTPPSMGSDYSSARVRVHS